MLSEIGIHRFTRRKQRLLTQLKKLGYAVQLTPSQRSISRPIGSFFEGVAGVGGQPPPYADQVGFWEV